MDDEVVRAFRAAVSLGTVEADARWAATGAAGIDLLRQDLSGVWRDEDPDDVDSRSAIDNLTAAVAAIAAAHPDTFLAAFAEGPLEANTFVLTGFGQIDDPRATERLAEAALSTDRWVRMHAAIGLGRRPSTLASDALGRLLADDDYLVRYHALKSLAKIGDDMALPYLRRFEPPPGIERTLADAAITAIADRAIAADESG
jgi:HEAT repeat protein